MSVDVLVVDDNPHVRNLWTEHLTQVGYRPYGVTSLSEARQVVAGRRFSAVLLDLYLPDGYGLDWIPELREECPDVAIIVVTGHGDIPQAVEAMRRGADHFLTKPVRLQDLEMLLRKSIDVRKVHKQYTARRRLDRQEEPFLGDSLVMRRVREMLASPSKAMCLSSSWGRLVRARVSSPGGFTSTAPAGRDPSSRSTARPSGANSWPANSSATPGAPSRRPWLPRRA